MPNVRALLHGGPLDGRMVTIDVDDPQDPPILYEVGFFAETLRAQVEFRVYRRAARNPYAGRIWDYEATGEVRRVPQPARDRRAAR
ncbi:hypothetical protein GCM10023322_10790 [Rugosimonospora acidiphila]|uniref:Uncharacterized protein n=1 Tax=Rugosimonospora acidiphila TaxID=556531 RepID=A0ABP9RKZ3_9ACTN